MKKLTVLIALLAVNVASAAPEALLRMPVLDFIDTDRDYVYEIKTSAFDKVELDCQSFITGMSFIQSDEVKNNVYIDAYECEGMVNFFKQSKADGVPVCLELDTDQNALMISEGEDCSLKRR